MGEDWVFCLEDHRSVRVFYVKIMVLRDPWFGCARLWFKNGQDGGVEQVAIKGMCLGMQESSSRQESVRGEFVVAIGSFWDANE